MSQWKKVKIGDICKIVKGTTGIASAEPGQYPLVVTAEERKTCSLYQFDCEAVCIPLVSSSGHGKKSLKNVHYQSGKFALGTILCAVIPNNPDELDARFLHQYLQFYKDTVLVPLMKGAANVSLSMKDIATVEFPLPPIEKQRELSNLFITLQESQKKLTAETEQQLEYTKQLRQNILQDAIEGKLTADWRKSHPVTKGNSDYDAEALFEKIQKGEVSPSLQPDKPSSATPSAGDTPATPPFAIPYNWKWVKVGQLGSVFRGSGIKRSDMIEKGKPVVRYGELYTTYGLKFSKTVSFISEDLFTKSKVFSKNAVIFTLTGENRQDIAKASAYLGDESVAASGDLACWINHHQEPLYLSYFMASRYFLNEKKRIATGDFIIHISAEKIKSVVLPLPPLKEQEEIVNRVESLLTKVTELENQIQERKTLSEKLAFGIIKEKLEG